MVTEQTARMCKLIERRTHIFQTPYFLFYIPRWPKCSFTADTNQPFRTPSDDKLSESAIRKRFPFLSLFIVSQNVSNDNSDYLSCPHFMSLSASSYTVSPSTENRRVSISFRRNAAVTFDRYEPKLKSPYNL